MRPMSLSTMKVIAWNRGFILGLFGTAVIVILIYIHIGKSDTLNPSRSTSRKSVNSNLPKAGLGNVRDAGDGGARRHSFEMKDNNFFLNGKKFRILSGAVHYFRVLPQYWEDRLLKLKAAGLNTVETYVPWNKHEEIRGQFNFDGILNLRAYIELAHRLGLYVLLRPGPYICSEWDFGGLPSWLLRNDRMQLRADYEQFLAATGAYFNQLIPHIADLQFSRGGPILMLQIENEYGSYGNDINYLNKLKEMLENRGIRQPLFLSENKGGIEKLKMPGVLMTANFKMADTGESMFKYLLESQPGLPLMVMEFWSGWFDKWGAGHHTLEPKKFEESLEFILESEGSVNFYMFHGGTNFGFMNGRNEAMPDVTSYDYDAPLSEAGDITPKYKIIRDLLVKHKLVKSTDLPRIPANSKKAAYGIVRVDKILLWEDILLLVQPIESNSVVTMELLDRNQGSGQGYGFILYRNHIPRVKNLHIQGHMKDRAMVVLNGQVVQIIEHPDKTITIPFPDSNMKDNNLLDILVENTGRISWGNRQNLETQHKGLSGTVKADDWDLQKWQMYPLEFKTDFLKGVSKSTKWVEYKLKQTTPRMYKFMMEVTGDPCDTFINMQGWTKGVVFVNGFNLGRYWNIGPTHTLYVPAPLLRTGHNQVMVFELHSGNDTLVSQESPILG